MTDLFYNLDHDPFVVGDWNDPHEASVHMSVSVNIVIWRELALLLVSRVFKLFIKVTSLVLHTGTKKGVYDALSWFKGVC